MKTSTRTMISSALAIALSTTAIAAPPEGKGGGKEKESNNSGGDGSMTPNPIAMKIDFRDGEADAVRSDGGAYDWNQPEGLRAHIDGDPGGNYGNLYLYMEPEVGREVFLALEDGCVFDCESLPFTARFFERVGIKVIAAESISGGVCGMAQGDVISARMNIKYHDELAYGTAGPGVIAFDAYTRKKHPCYQATSMIRVERGTAANNTENTWTVSNELGAACVTWPDGRTHGGVVHMPFEITATVINPDNPDEPACE
jgi:hypothetical protein